MAIGNDHVFRRPSRPLTPVATRLPEIIRPSRSASGTMVRGGSDETSMHRFPTPTSFGSTNTTRALFVFIARIPSHLGWWRSKRYKISLA
ncbi:hypothetical protein OG21DRAFT_1516666 [Imleria badia]|nr:hypothetical protein OG21DRAFT_1516666 [Imleria badia]